ncbi:hypothetical protein [Paenibacillus agricola]|uniref:Uncharacterized protein n=1 Tax=Paenibacillus agricola TaxID=2716264 RepID=A0ABX0JJ72_9BACL|nr:hypothetical protein [Paenibacillus agricola]NHN34813.1 hypothetical protein [Paenibacillus agricola]
MKKQAIIQLKDRHRLSASINEMFDGNPDEKERPSHDLVGTLLFIIGMNFLKVQKLKRPLSSVMTNPVTGIDQEEACKLLSKNGFTKEELYTLEFFNIHGTNEDLIRYLDRLIETYENPHSKFIKKYS